jgi:hypothetical protein
VLEELLPDELAPGTLVTDADDELLVEVVVEELLVDEVFVEEVPDELPEEPPTAPLFPLTDGLETPVPAKDTRIEEPFALAKTSWPLKDSAALGLNVTKTVKLEPGAKLMGSEGPRYENWAMDVETFSILTLVRSLLLTTTWTGAVAVPTVDFPKFTSTGVAVTVAWAAVLQTASNATSDICLRIRFLSARLIMFSS